VSRLVKIILQERILQVQLCLIRRDHRGINLDIYTTVLKSILRSIHSGDAELIAVRIVQIVLLLGLTVLEIVENDNKVYSESFHIYIIAVNLVLRNCSVVDAREPGSWLLAFQCLRFRQSPQL
jgi:hypothetical protein